MVTILPLLLLITVAIIILVIAFICKKISFRSNRNDQIQEKLAKLERDMEELKASLQKDER